MLCMIQRGDIMGISKRMLFGTAFTGGVYFFLGELLFRGLKEKMYMPLLIGFYFLGLMIFVIMGIRIIGATMTRLIRPYRDITLRCLLLCLAILAAGCFLEFLYEKCFQEKFTEPVSYIFAIDNSGSMADNDPENKRYDAIQSVLSLKKPNFSFAVYLFADTSQQIRSMNPISHGTEFYMEAPGGGTGIQTVLGNIYNEINNKTLELGDNSRVLLFTDGAATDMKPFLSKVHLSNILDQYAKRGISISTIGLGNTNDRLMELIAKKTGGIYVPVEDTAQLEDAMEQAAKANGKRNLLDYRSYVKYDWFFVLLRITAIIVLGVLLGMVKMYLCEPFLETHLLWKTSVGCSLAAAACVELGMNHLGFSPSLMRFFMCVLLAEGTLGKKGFFDSGEYNLYRHF